MGAVRHGGSYCGFPQLGCGSTGVNEDWAYYGLGWTRPQHPSVHLRFGVEGGTDQAVAFTDMCVGDVPNLTLYCLAYIRGKSEVISERFLGGLPSWVVGLKP